MAHTKGSLPLLNERVLVFDCFVFEPIPFMVHAAYRLLFDLFHRLQSNSSLHIFK